MKNQLQILSNRQLWRSLLAYPAAAFVILQAVDFFIINYDLNSKFLTLSLILLIGGFFIAFIWNWNHGEKGVQIFTKREIAAYVCISISTLILGGTYWSRYESVNLQINEEQNKKFNTLAILPFTNASEDISLAYLSDGIPENLINRLSSIVDLRVLSRNSTFTLDPSERNPDNLRKKLNADIMLSGQLDMIEDQLIINCQLVDVSNNNQIWGNKMYFSNENIIKLEDSIVTSLLNPLRISLKDDKEIASVGVNTDPKAYTHYLKGRHLSYGSTAEEAEKALEHFRKALEIQPSFVPAYVAIANEKIVQAMFATATRKEIFNEARMAVQSALALHPNSSEALLVSGSIMFYGDFDWKGAEKAYKKAIIADPNNSNAYIRYSAYLVALKKYDESIEMAHKAIGLDPISISSLHNLGWVYLVSRKFKKSEDTFTEALALHPNWTWGYIKRAYARMFQGKYESAQQDVLSAKELIGEWGSELLQVAMIKIYKTCGNEEMVSEYLQQFFDRINDDNYSDPFSVFYAYCFAGDIETGLDWAERTVKEKAPGAYQFNLDIFYTQEMLENPRFIKVRESMNF